MGPGSDDWIPSITLPETVVGHELIEEPFGGLIVIGGIQEIKYEGLFKSNIFERAN